MLSRLHVATAIAAAFGAAVVAAPANAATVIATKTFGFTLYDTTKANLGTGNLGTVQVSQLSNGKLSFVVTPGTNVLIHQTTSTAHEAFAFSIKGDPDLSLSNLTKGFSGQFLTSGTNINEAPFGTFQSAISCDSKGTVKKPLPGACGPGIGGGFAGPLSFDVMRANGIALTLADLQSNLYMAQNVFFTMDVVMRDVYGNVFTGNLGAVEIQGSVPEPEAWMTMILGFGVLGATMRRRNAIIRPGRSADLA